MSDPLSAAARYRSDAAKFSELAESAQSPFPRDYYKRLAQRYLMHAENQEKIAKISDEFAAGRHQDDPIPDSPSVQADPEATSPEEASTSDQPPSPPPLQPAQGPASASRRSRRRRPTP
jgi:hypothetical protein